MSSLAFNLREFVGSVNISDVFQELGSRALLGLGHFAGNAVKIGCMTVKVHIPY